MAENYNRFRAGLPLENVVVVEKGLKLYSILKTMFLLLAKCVFLQEI